MAAASYIEPVSGTLYPLDVPRWCSDGRKPLLVTRQPGISRDDIERGARSLWRYRASLPVNIADPISMGEGCTPLVQRPWGDHRPLFKLEWFNPTGSFKDRGTSVMLSSLHQIGIDAVLEDSSGNGGSSVAGYGAAGGMRVKILAPAYTSPAKIAQVRAYGAEVQLVEGPREESEAEAIRQSGRIFYSSHNWQPFFLEGTKSLAYELWEDLGFEAPDNVVIPVGAGSSLLGCAFGFRELLNAGQITKLPRLFVAQPLNCSPIDASFQAGVDTPVLREVHKTIAEGTSIKSPLRLREVIAAVRESGGGTVALREEEIVVALKRLARQGLFAEPTCASAAAALDRLGEAGTIKPGETTIVIVTGTGLKAATAVAELTQQGVRMARKRRPDQGRTPDDTAALFAQLEQIAQGLAATFAPFCEVVLHDLADPKNAIRAIHNNLSARKVGDPVTELGLARLTDPDYPQVTANYANTFADGRQVKSTSIGVKDANGAYVAALCLNVDLTLFQALQGAIGQFTSAAQQRVSESLNPAGAEAIRARIDLYAARHATTPRALPMEERRTLLRELKGAGFLEVRRAAEIIAAHLGVSRATVYQDVK